MLRKTTKNISQNGQCPGQNSNQRFSEIFSKLSHYTTLLVNMFFKERDVHLERIYCNNAQMIATVCGGTDVVCLYTHVWARLEFHVAVLLHTGTLQHLKLLRWANCFCFLQLQCQTVTWRWRSQILSNVGDYSHHISDDSSLHMHGCFAGYWRHMLYCWATWKRSATFFKAEGGASGPQNIYRFLPECMVLQEFFDQR